MLPWTIDFPKLEGSLGIFWSNFLPPPPAFVSEADGGKGDLPKHQVYPTQKLFEIFNSVDHWPLTNRFLFSYSGPGLVGTSYGHST